MCADAVPTILFVLEDKAHRQSEFTFPTRRSSDLAGDYVPETPPEQWQCAHQCAAIQPVAPRYQRGQSTWHPGTASSRSEEHTSELQSRGHLVCRLLPEKKKNGFGKGGAAKLAEVL